ncbi:hypothetical protein HJG53_00905 [Sphingomonas sp. ID1715]|uniref:hypothetical protein n=1 Tax=Sphingomonas sp. ID1715 TaxID=1656898 RepID=UPI0017ADA269|nr:hypothetical protein [Sphingomonas sp. ID1715]NNM75468.1 hypothetical protein [Sphingomonas sp. ID1715]
MTNAEQRAEKIAITPESKMAAIIFKSPQLPVPPTVQSAYRLHIAPYDPAEGVMKGLFGAGRSIAAKPKLLYDGYYVSDVEPGTYVFGSLSRQDYWAVCFNGGSRQFTVRAGEVLYLGDFDARKHVTELERLAITSGRITSRNSEAVHFFDTVAPPAFAPVSEDDLVAVAAMMKVRMPNTSVAPKAVTFADAKFGTGSDLFGLNRVCGGYYRKGAR